MIYGYARVSTLAQDLASQLAQLKAAGCESVFREKITGATADRPQLRKLMTALAPGDVVIIPAVDRLSRDTTDLLVIARGMQRAGTGLRSLAEPVLDTTGDFAELVLAVLAVAAKLERRRIAERTARGRADARAKGVKFGRKPILTPHQQREAQERVVSGEPQRSIARSYNVSQATISRLGAIPEHVEMKLYSHVITDDTGLAPNPFHGFCTSALCTPSHKNAKLKNGDWLIGNSRRREGNRLVYAMRISEVLSMNHYFRDGRFERKKPQPDGTWIDQCGDNIYFRDGDGQWKRLPSPFHNDRNAFVKDVGGNFSGRPVFVAEHFYYFGRRSVAIPDKLAGVICGGIGIHDKSDLADDFVNWLENNYQSGVLGMPRDMPDHAGESGMILTELISDGATQTKNRVRGNCRPMLRSVTETQLRSRGCR